LMCRKRRFVARASKTSRPSRVQASEDFRYLGAGGDQVAARGRPRPLAARIWVLSGRPPSRANKPLRQAFSGHAIGRAQVRDLGEGRSAVGVGHQRPAPEVGHSADHLDILLVIVLPGAGHDRFTADCRRHYATYDSTPGSSPRPGCLPESACSRTMMSPIRSPRGAGRDRWCSGGAAEARASGYPHCDLRQESGRAALL
jgi:hypothetical protein